MHNKYIVSVLVKNHSGVLARVASLFGRRAFNIDSLTVSATTNPKISRMSIIVTADEKVLEQVIKQISKLYEVIEVEQLWEDESYCKELVFVKMSAPDALSRNAIREVAEVYEANIVESQGDTMIIELTEVPSRIDAFLDVIANFEMIEMCRSGVTAMVK
ncbi:MAG: acetolactate synthase small subunit [Butyricicoccus pullicaecorum]|nr:acetolactate synthase small subunit [Butyricicoccus pullicaecorum]